jgi:hypothetical protein
MSTEVNTSQVEALKKIKELVNLTYEAGLKAAEAEAYYNNLKQSLTEVMQASEVDSFEAETCKAFCKPKSSVSLPKDLGSKARVFDYIKNKYGADTLEEMLTINPKTFNSWYNAEAEAALSEGNLDFKLAGITPYEYFSVSFRKKSNRK